MDLRTHMPGPRRANRLPYLPGWAAHGVIVVGGAIVFTLMMWGHLGLGAWIAPPPPTASRRMAMAGPYRVTLALGAGQFTRGAHNTAILSLTDAQGRAVDDATVRVQPRMVTMVMQTPEVIGVGQGGGRYIIHPAFAMPGEWRLGVTLAQPGMPDQQTSFDVNVRWE